MKAIELLSEDVFNDKLDLLEREKDDLLNGESDLEFRGGGQYGIYDESEQDLWSGEYGHREYGDCGYEDALRAIQDAINAGLKHFHFYMEDSPDWIVNEDEYEPTNDWATVDVITIQL